MSYENETGKKVQQAGGKAVKTVIKLIGIKAIILAAILGSVCSLLVSAIYVVQKEDVDDVLETEAKYKASITPGGKVIYKETVPNEEPSGENNSETTKEVDTTIDKMAKELYEELKEYIDLETEEEGIKEIKYLINAEMVTKIPYIENTAEDEVQGQIKFYRYTGESESNDAYTDAGTDNEKLKEAYRITYKSQTEFEKLKSNYVSSGDETVFNHFTMDSEGNVIVAYGSVEKRKITTDKIADQDLTLEMVKAESGEESYSGTYKNGFEFEKREIHERPINYLSFVQKYIMPSNLLYQFLIQTRDIHFVHAIAELAYNNDIGIGIYDNESVYTENITYTYKKLVNMDGSIELNFADVNTTNPHITEKEIKEQYILNNLIPHSASYKIVNGKSVYTRVSEVTDATSNVNMYVAGVNKDGKINKLGNKDEASVFTVNYNRTIEAKSNPTVGLVMADTWMAKWKSSYIRKEDEPVDTSDSGEYEDYKLADYNTTDALLDIFTKSMQDDINNKLSEHAEKKLKTKTIEIIVNKTDFTENVTAKTIKLEDIPIEQRKELFLAHFVRMSRLSNSTINVGTRQKFWSNARC